MSSRKKIAINSVLLDPENARHGDKASQRDIYAWMCGDGIGAKVLKLAAEIAREGVSPLETPGVIPAAEGAGKPWIVVEGNRRVAALKFLNNPKLCPDLKLRKQYERLKNNAETPIASKIEFVVFENIAVARYWIETRHGGENGGSGIIGWGPMEVDNFAARFGKRTTNRPAVELIDYAYKNGLISYDEFKSVPVTTLYRLLSTPEVRQEIGCDLIKGHLYQIADDEYFNRAIAKVLRVLASGEKTVTDLKTKKQREDFAKQLKAAEGWADYVEREPLPVASGVTADAEDMDEADEPGVGHDEFGDELKPKQPRGTQTPSWDRKTLFPRNKDGIPIPEEHIKAKNIVAELRKLKTGGSTGTPIAIAMLLRALVELSTNRYRDVFGVRLDQDFHRQVAYVADHMKSNAFIGDDQHALLIRMTRESESMLHVKTLQKYVHSDAFHPTADILNSLWDQISFYVGACWRHSPNA